MLVLWGVKVYFEAEFVFILTILRNITFIDDECALHNESSTRWYRIGSK